LQIFEEDAPGSVSDDVQMAVFMSAKGASTLKFWDKGITAYKQMPRIPRVHPEFECWT